MGAENVGREWQEYGGIHSCALRESYVVEFFVGTH